MTEIILSTAGLTRDFRDFRAVDDVSLNIHRGSMTGLIGPNGAGKSTIFNLLTGVLPPTAGQVFLRGVEVTGSAPDQLFSKGVARTFQIPRPFARMTVLENLMMVPLAQSGETILGPFLHRLRVRDEEARNRARAMDVLDFTTLAPLADHPAGKISGGQMKLMELARVLMGDPSVILLDEPTAGVAPALTDVLIEKIEALNRDGKTFVIIEHNMDFVMRHCDPVIAMAEGRIVFEGTAANAQQDPTLLDAYLGVTMNA
ncbi:MAG: ABC transporter ATP-binding protein [Pseudomonadota bacterium]